MVCVLVLTETLWSWGAQISYLPASEEKNQNLWFASLLSGKCNEKKVHLISPHFHDIWKCCEVCEVRQLVVLQVGVGAWRHDIICYSDQEMWVFVVKLRIPFVAESCDKGLEPRSQKGLTGHSPQTYPVASCPCPTSFLVQLACQVL